MPKFIIPQIEEKETLVKEEASKPTLVKQKNDDNRFISPFFGRNVKDEVSAVSAQYGNQGRQYDVFRDKDKQMVDSNKDYYTRVDDRLVSARHDLTEEEIKTPSYLRKDPVYADIYGENPRSIQSSGTSPIINQYEEKEVKPEISFDEEEVEKSEEFEEFEEKEEHVIQEVQEKVFEEEVHKQVLQKEPEPERKAIKFRRREKYTAPPFSILKKGGIKASTDQEAIDFQINAINSTLAAFKIGAHVVSYTKGPTVTEFEVQTDPGVRVASIANIENDLQAACMAQSIRVQSPIPGKSTVGIELPNAEKDKVLFGDLVDNNAFLNDGKPLNTVIGLDTFGDPLYFNIAKAPHAIIAGTTGSGKSVCINCIINSIIYKCHPEDVKLILVDPKILEFSAYEHIPHLAMPVLTESKQVQAALKWCCEEMDNRYRMMKPFNMREIDSFNSLSRTNPSVPHLPYIVVIVDELAELFGTSGSEVPQYIQRLVQKGRAAGIHLLLATQRPSVDVISGTIKANCPVRIAFKVKTGTDSSIILDHQGAEALLGLGDMLFNDSVNETRAQGAFISNEEIASITEFLGDGDANYVVNLEEEVQKVQSQDSSVIDDSEFASVARFVVENHCASINRIQKEFNMGFNKSQMIMETLESAGIVGENLGSRAREVLVTISELEQMLADKKING